MQNTTALPFFTGYTGWAGYLTGTISDWIDQVFLKAISAWKQSVSNTIASAKSACVG
jgi:hypothetical protein